MKKVKKISTLLALCFLGSFIVSIVACILVQYFFISKTPDIVEFLKHDAIHVFFLGIIMFSLFFVVIKILILAPLHKIYERLYAIAYRKNRGTYSIDEEDFEDIIKGINHLIRLQEKDIECSSMQETHKIIEQESLTEK